MNKITEEFKNECLKHSFLVAAQHLEGGPEAQLYLKIKDFEAKAFSLFVT